MKKVYIKPLITTVLMDNFCLDITSTQVDSYNGQSSNDGPQYEGEGEGDDYAKGNFNEW